MANAFSILALAEPWRSELEPPGPGPSSAVTVDDPRWLFTREFLAFSIAIDAAIGSSV